MAPGRGLPARAEEPLIRINLLIKDGEPGRGFGLHGHFRTFLGLLGAGESQTELEAGTSHKSPAGQGHPSQTHTGTGQAGACVKKDFAKNLTVRG